MSRWDQRSGIIGKEKSVVGDRMGLTCAKQNSSLNGTVHRLKNWN